MVLVYQYFGVIYCIFSGILGSCKEKLNMEKFWVADTKAKISSESSYEQDGSEWYYGRSVVPARSAEDAISILKMALRDKHVEIEAVLAVVDYTHQNWDSDDDDLYDTVESYEKSKAKNQVVTGVFASGMYLERE